jgi:aspartokinase-like uncharacterized kinase
MPKQDLIIVKVGGSLYKQPTLRSDLFRLFANFPNNQVAVFPGGGGLADAIRELDSAHHLGEERSHWLAVHSLSVAAHFLADLLTPQAAVTTSLPSCRGVWKRGLIGIVDPRLFARLDARRTDALPRSWRVTSDSMALRLAQCWRASRLLLLKSVSPPSDWIEDDSNQFVDAHFRTLWRASAHRPEITALNFQEIAN